MADEVVNISIQADIRQLREQLATLPGVGDKEARKMVSALERQYKAATKAAQKSAADTEREWRRSMDTIKGVAEKGAGMLGGVFGDLGDVVLDMGSKLGGVAGPAGIAVAGIAGVVMGAAAAATAMDDFVASADPAIARLKEIGGAPPLPPDTIAALDDYRQASLGAEAGVARLRVRLAGMAAGAFEPAAAAAAGFLERLDALLPSAEAVTQATEEIALISRVTLGVFSLGATEAVRWASGIDELAAAGRTASADLEDLAAKADALRSHESAAKEVAKIQTEAILKMTGASDAAIALSREVDRLDESYNAYVKDLDLSNEATRAQADAVFESVQIAKAQAVASFEAGEALKAHTAATRAQTEAARREAEDAKAVNDALREQRTAREAIASVLRDAGSDELTDVDKINAAYDERIAKIREAAAVTADFGVASAAEAAVEERRHRDLGELRIGLEKQVADAREKADQAVVAAAEDAQQHLLQTLDKVSAGVGAVGQGLSSVQSIMETVSSGMIEQAADGTKAQQAAALRAFRTAKALAIASAAVDAALAAIALVPAYAFLGPGAPIAAAATAGAAFAATVAKINSSPPPSFARGGVVPGGGPRGTTPDHVLIQAQPGKEGVANGRGMDTLGGPDGLERLNRGELPHGRPVRVGVHLNGREIAQATWDPLGSLVEGRPLGRRPSYG